MIVCLGRSSTKIGRMPNTTAPDGHYLDDHINSAPQSQFLERTKPMPLSMHQLTVPVFVQYLDALSGVLDKAAAHCEAHKIDESVLLQMRVSPDMFDLARQVGIALHFSGGIIAQLAGIEAPNFGAENASFADLKGQIAKTVDFIKGVTPEQLEGSADREIELKQATRTLNFNGQVFLLHHAMPQFCFHTTTAYNILRHAGVEIGKRDYMGEYPS